MPETELVPETVLTPQHVPPTGGALAASPYSFEFRTSDTMRLTVHNADAGITVAVHYRVLTRDQGIIATRHIFEPTADRLASDTEFAIGEGYLLNATVFAASGQPRRGQTFVRLRAQHGRGGSATTLATLIQGYVTEQQDRAWPGSPLEGSLEGDGYTRSVNGTDPAAGADIVESVPTGARWRLRAVKAGLVTSATAGTRIIGLRLRDPGTTTYAFTFQTLTQLGSQFNDYIWMLGLPLATTFGVATGTAGLPDMVLVAGVHIHILAVGMLAGDNWNVPVITVDEWLEAQ